MAINTSAVAERCQRKLSHCLVAIAVACSYSSIICFTCSLTNIALHV